MAPEIIDIRQFDARAFQPLLQAESRVWIENLRWDYTASAELISSCLQERRLAGYALVSRDRILGYSFFFYEGEKGLIGNLFVDSAGGPGLQPALLLLDHVLETMLATPGISRVETQLPHYTLEELEPAFRARNFEGYNRRFMAVGLALWARQTTGAPSEGGEAGAFPAEFQMVPWERRHDREAAQLLYLTYRNHVDGAINDQYSSPAGADRLIENIVRQRGCGEHLPQASQVAIHLPSRKLAGILALTSVRAGTAHIPQIAIAREFQGCGLGSAMMERSFQALSKRGFHEVSLTVTESNAGALRLYERLGFKTFRTFGAFVWSSRAPGANESRLA